MPYRAGDVVHHGPSGEDWLLAADEHNGEVYPGGWPESVAQASDCTLVRVASDEARLAMLMDAAGIGDGDVRGRRARADLEAMGITPPEPRQRSLFG